MLLWRIEKVHIHTFEKRQCLTNTHHLLIDLQISQMYSIDKCQMLTLLNQQIQAQRLGILLRLIYVVLHTEQALLDFAKALSCC